MRKMRERPIQIYLRPDQDAAIRAMAKTENVAIAELVRRGIDQMLTSVPVGQDPTLKLIGIGNSGLGDLAENHDYYIVQAIMAETEPPQPKPTRPKRKRAKAKPSYQVTRKRKRAVLRTN
jgi:hypothetical protein